MFFNFNIWEGSVDVCALGTLGKPVLPPLLIMACCRNQTHHRAAPLSLLPVLSFTLLHILPCLQALHHAPGRSAPLDWEVDELPADVFLQKSGEPGGDGEYGEPDPAPPQNEEAGAAQELRRLMEMQQHRLEQVERLMGLLRRSIDTLQFEFCRRQRGVPEGEDPVPASAEIRLRHSERRFEQDEARLADFSSAEDEQKSDGVPPVWKDKKAATKHAREISGVSQSGTPPPPPPPPLRPPQSNQREGASSGGYNVAASVTIAKYKPAWSQYFQILSAVKIEGEVTCLHVFPRDGEDGVSRYVAVGDNKGCVHIFQSHGNLLVGFSTISESPVTAMRSFSLRRNVTVLITGHLDGVVLIHEILETVHTDRSLGDDLYALSMKYVKSLLPPLSKDTSVAASQASDPSLHMSERGADSNRNRDVGGPITNLEIFRVGKMRYVLVSDTQGTIQVFRENGTFYGMAKSPTCPLAFLRSPNSQRLLFLTETGAASLDLRSMKVRMGPCEGLNGSTVIAYVFDVAGGSKAYGLTAQGEVVYVSLSGYTLHFECYVRSRMNLDFEKPLALHGIRGYLLAASPNHIYVFNTTIQGGFTYRNIGVGGPRHLFTASVNEVSVSFVNTPIARSHKPVMACNSEKLVVLGFGNGYVGIYRSNLPVLRPPLPVFNSKLWSTPIFMLMTVLLGGWIFIGRKRQAAPSWMSDIPPDFNTSTVPGYARTGIAEAESLIEPRSFSSESKDFSHSSGSFRRNSLNYRTPAMDRSFRTTLME